MGRGGVWFLGRTRRAPSPPARGLRECCKLPQWGPGRSPGRNRFWCISKLVEAAGRVHVGECRSLCEALIRRARVFPRGKITTAQNSSTPPPFLLSSPSPCLRTMSHPPLPCLALSLREPIMRVWGPNPSGVQRQRPTLGGQGG